MSYLSRLFGGLQSPGHQVIPPADYKARFMESAQDHTLLDVRTAEEFAAGYIPGALNISLQDLQQQVDRVPTDKPVVVYCRSGNRSAFAARILQQAGYTEVYDLGGIIEWARAGLPIAR